MLSSCLESEERRRFEGRRMQNSCFELEERRRVENKDAEQLLRLRREMKS